MIQKCEKCNNEFTYTEKLKTTLSMLGYKDLKCKNCDTSYKVSTSTDIISRVLMVSPLLFRDYLKNIRNIFFIYLAYVVFITFITPLFIKYNLINDKKES